MQIQGHQPRSSERGQMLVIAALLITTLLGLLALAVDAGLAYSQRTGAQNASDNAALAAAEVYYQTTNRSQALAAATEYGQRNGFADGVNGVGLTVLNPPASGPHAGDLRFFEVDIAKPSPNIFLRLISGGSHTVGARAVAGITTGPEDYGLLLLNPSMCKSLDVSGSGDTIILNAGVMVDSNCASEAFKKTGSGSVMGDVLDVVGGYNGPLSPCPPADPMNPPNDTVCPRPRTGRPYVSDPLAGLPEPDLSVVGISPDSGGTPANPQRKSISNGDYTFRPGVYYGGIHLSTNGNITFEPGLYVMAGGGLDISSSGTLNGNGVTFYNTFDPQNPSGDGRCEEMHISGSNNTGSALTPPTSGPYKDVIIWQDPNCLDNGNGVRFHHSGSGNLQTTGIIYLPTGWLHISGSGSTGAVQIIADHMQKSGSSDVVVDYQHFIDIKPPRVALVE